MQYYCFIIGDEEKTFKRTEANCVYKKNQVLGSYDKRGGKEDYRKVVSRKRNKHTNFGCCRSEMTKQHFTASPADKQLDKCESACGHSNPAAPAYSAVFGNATHSEYHPVCIGSDTHIRDARCTVTTPSLEKLCSSICLYK